MDCPSCKSQDTFVTEHVAADDPERPVWECRVCTLQYLKPIDNLREFYDKHYRKGESVVDRYWRQRYIAHWSYRAFRNAVPTGGKVLDIGCSAGGFLSLLEHDYDCIGLEWNTEDATFVQDVGELPCSQESITECFPEMTFDAIVARQVLEHQIAPHQFLEDCLSRLAPGGVLFMEMPNNDYPHNSSDWYATPHCLYWNAKSLEIFFTGHLGQNNYSSLDISKWAYRPHLIEAGLPDMMRVVTSRA
jgi:SAM-dependent methyltransferase